MSRDLAAREAPSRGLTPVYSVVEQNCGRFSQSTRRPAKPLQIRVFLSGGNCCRVSSRRVAQPQLPKDCWSNHGADSP